MSAPRPEATLHDQFGNIDIYLFDQLLRGRVPADAHVCDVGCGWGRNLVYLLQHGYRVSAVDGDADAVAAVRRMAEQWGPRLPADGFRVEAIETLTFPDGYADVVISSAVLHFARDHEHFDAMLRQSWRILRAGGLLFCRLASSIGIEARVRPTRNGRYWLPDGSERYLVDEARLVDLTRTLGGALLDPIKTTIVQDQRSMTTWVVRKLG
jgi:SAM-dependent methyltransferase